MGMSAESISAFAAVAGVVVTVLGGMAILIWNAGRHSQRLDATEDDIRTLKANAHEAGKLDTALQVLTGRFSAMERRIDEVGHDVKNLLTGKIRPPTRRPE